VTPRITEEHTTEGTSTPDAYPDDPADRGSSDGPPRWVTVLGIAVAVVVVLVFVALHLSGAVGPGAH
jgi:hypothetical protein